VSTPYDEIMALLKEVEKEAGLPHGTLKKIYDEERNAVFMENRAPIFNNLRSIITSLAEKRGKK
jgi:hypothetical protein